MSAVPLASQDGWSYGGGDFYVEASGHNRHRRATLPELKAHFDTGSDKPAHWYEAQLLHYGLPPSKTKGTAKMRLFEAVQKGNMSVPAHLSKLESALKKDWTKMERESKQALKKGVDESTTPARGTKRKADTAPAQYLQGTHFNLSLSFSTGPLGNLQVVPAEPSSAPKKARASKATTQTTPAKESKAKPKPAAKTIASKPTPTKATKTTVSKKPTPAAPVVSLEDSLTPISRTPQTARRSAPAGISSRGGGQTARRGGATSSSSSYNGYYDQTAGMSMSSGGYFDPPPPYPGSASIQADHEVADDSLLRPLGLLNGRYEACVTGPPAAQDHKADSGIIMTLDGNTLWGTFEIGPQTGMFRLENRPRQSSHQQLSVTVACEDDDGVQYGDQKNWISFLGGGHVRGTLPFRGGELTFEGHRISGQETRSEISAWDMRAHWDTLLR